MDDDSAPPPTDKMDDGFARPPPANDAPAPPPPVLTSGSPTDFLKGVVGKRVVVRLTSGVDYRGAFLITASPIAQTLMFTQACYPASMDT